MSEGIPKSARDALAKQTAGDAHPSPDLLNAYMEQSLGEDENTAVLVHLAGCAACREVVFLAGGVTEEELQASAKDEVARARVPMPAEVQVDRLAAAPRPPEIAGCAVLEPRPKPPRRWWKWAVPAFAAVLAVSAGILEHDNIRDRMSPTSPSMAKVEHPAAPLGQPNSSSESAAANPPGTPPADSVSPVSPLQDRAKGQSNEKGLGLPPVQTKEPAAPDRELKQRQDELQRSEQAQLASNLEASKDKSDMAALSAPAAVAKAVPPSETKPAARAGAAPPPPPPPARQAAEATSAAPLVQADNADLSTNFSQALISNSATGAMQAKKAAPAHWRISSDGHVERMVGPSTWERVMSAEPVTFHVVATVAHNVWAGGSDGALFHSSDGGHEWNRVALAGEQGTIESITFHNAQQGSLTTEAGSVWKTTDGGETWTKQ